LGLDQKSKFLSQTLPPPFFAYPRKRIACSIYFRLIFSDSPPPLRHPLPLSNIKLRARLLGIRATREGCTGWRAKMRSNRALTPLSFSVLPEEINADLKGRVLLWFLILMRAFAGVPPKLPCVFLLFRWSEGQKFANLAEMVRPVSCRANVCAHRRSASDDGGIQVWRDGGPLEVLQGEPCLFSLDLCELQRGSRQETLTLVTHHCRNPDLSEDD